MDTLLERPTAGGTGRLAWADLLRVLTTFAVVLLHTSTTWLALAEEGSAEWTALMAWDGLTRWCVPVFVLLSGAFLLDPNKPLTVRFLLRGRLPRILAALLAWGFFYNLIYFRNAGAAGVRNALLLTLRGQTEYHLWYLYMLLGLYLLTPVLRGLVRGCSRRELEWLLALWFLAGLLLPTVLSYFPSVGAQSWLKQLDLPLIGGYPGYYVAGYYLRTYDLRPHVRYAVYALGLSGLAATLALGSDVYGYLTPNVACTACALFLLCRQCRLRPSRVAGLSDCSFGVYLSHVFFLMLLNHFGLTTLRFTSRLSAPRLSLAVFFCAAGTARALRKLPVVGAYIT